MTFNTENLQEVLLEPTTLKHELMWYDGPTISILQNGESLWYEAIIDDNVKQTNVRLRFIRIRITQELEEELVKRYAAQDDSANWETIEKLVFPLNKPIFVIDILNDGSEHAYLVESYSKIKETYDNW